jgi:lysyl-tRNA synthetase class II
METITLKINTRSNKGKFLIGLIREMAKDRTFIEIESNVMDEIATGLKQVKK